jgi:NADH-quinone oxidoreductase subunit L
MSPTAAGWIVLALPLFGALALGLGFRLWRGPVAGVIGTATIGGSFLFSVLALIGLQGKDEHHRQIASSLWDYAKVGGVDVRMEILVDPLSVTMLLVVTGVSTLIHLYSMAYMRGDEGYSRFFAYLNFFVFSMLLLVLAGNFVLLIVGWAFVGAASYMLVSFWYRRTTATSAGIKAFVINVVGDIGLVLGAILLLSKTGTVDFLDTFAVAKETFGEGGTASTGSLTAGLLLIMVGAFAKSAQLPLHTWLPDAMEGPTPVSSLIHAATMVTAGVYLIARLHPLFQLSETAMAVGACIGLATLLVAGTIGLTQTDLKRVIAYSTMSQIGYMIMGVSAGAYVAGMFHLATHAFFKALLFMAAGSLIAAMAGEQSLDKMGGFRKAMPFTFAAFVIGGLALAGIPPFSGFFSKDEILAVLAEEGGWHWILVVGGYIGAFLTAVYTWRMIFRAFWGPPVPEAKELEEGHLHHADVHRNPGTGEIEDTGVGFPGPEHHIAERALPMRIAMGGLAVLAVLGGLLGIPKVLTPLEHFLEPTFADVAHPAHPGTGLILGGMAVGTLLGLAGIYVAYLIWARPLERGEPATAISAGWQQRFAPIHKLFVNKWWFDELIDLLIVRPTRAIGRLSHDAFERLVVGGALMGGATGATRGASALVRRAQSGFLRSYAAVVLSGLVVVLVVVLVAS